MLNPEVFSDKKLIQRGLKEPFIVIKNALVPDIAEQLYNDLINFQSWKYLDHQSDLSPREQATQNKLSPEYTFSRDNITLGRHEAPESVENIFNYLRSSEIRSYFSEVSGRPCNDFQLSATMFREGNHIADHNDYYILRQQDGSTITRALTFNYYLTKNWQPEWGGKFIWKRPHTEITPSFNTLVLFNVGQASYHFVEAVSKQAEQPRIALTGWYLSIRKTAEKKASLFK